MGGRAAVAGAVAAQREGPGFKSRPGQRCVAQLAAVV